MIDALVLAGSSNKGELVSHCGATKEALIKLGSQPMVWYVLQALQTNHQIDRICLVGITEGEVPYIKADRVVFCPAGQDPIDSLGRGVESINTDKDKLLVLTADIPLITPEAIEDFLCHCQEDDCDIYYPIVDKNVVQARYPGVERTYVELKDGTFTGGNLFLIKTRAIASILHHGQRLIQYRKRPLLIARYLGFGMVIRYLIHQLSIGDIVQRVAEIAATSGKAVISPYPEIGFDVDKISDYEIVKQQLLHSRVG